MLAGELAKLIRARTDLRFVFSQDRLGVILRARNIGLYYQWTVLVKQKQNKANKGVMILWGWMEEEEEEEEKPWNLPLSNSMGGVSRYA